KEFKDKIVIKIKSKTKKQFCPLCRSESRYHQATYERVIDDLPLFGKPVQLIVTAYKYKCFNPECEQKVFCEELHGFAGKYRIVLMISVRYLIEKAYHFLMSL
ncbi:MAG: transposase family protein, partial [Clostridium sp.]|nr:transposase family protein [Clostridium sp.]